MHLSSKNNTLPLLFFSFLSLTLLPQKSIYVIIMQTDLIIYESFPTCMTFFLHSFSITKLKEVWNAKKHHKCNSLCSKSSIAKIKLNYPFKRYFFLQLNILWCYIMSVILWRQDVRKNVKMDLELREPQLKYWVESCLWSPISSTTCQYYECPVAITALRNEQYRLILPLLLQSAGLQSSNSFC